MRSCERQKLSGKVEIILRDKDGTIVDRKKMKNLITSMGKSLVANLFRGTEKQAVSHMAVGTGKTPPSPQDTKLGSELAPRRPFDKNMLVEESCASIILVSEKGTDVLKFTSNRPGTKGNDIAVKVSRGAKDTVRVQIYDINVGEESIEEYKDMNMNPEEPIYLPEAINNESELVHAEFLADELPEPTDWLELTDGSDAVVTLSSTFGYGDANGTLTEAGIFNANKEGTMYNRVVFPEIHKTDKLTLSLIWRISF